MTSMMLKSDSLYYNPLDIAESVIMDRDWVFDRTDETQLIAEVNGACCNYRIWFSWQEDSGGLTLSCSLDAKLPKKARERVYTLLALANEKMWLGHFDICSEDSTVTFRHSLLLREDAGTSQEHMRELIDIAITECDRFYPAFQSVIWGGKTPAEALEIAMFETIAEA
jgi:hypothetical protein